MATTLASAVSRVVSLGVGLVTLRMVVPYLGVERYGLWMAMSSILVWASMADLGFTRGLGNLIADAEGRSSQDKAARLSSSTFFALLIIGGAVGTLFTLLAVNDLIPFHAIGIPSELRDEASRAFIALTLVFAIGLPASVSGTILLATQRGHITQLLSIPASILSLVLTAVALHSNSELYVVIAAGASSQLLPQVAGFYFVRKLAPHCMPAIKTASLQSLKEMWALSASAVSFQLGVLLVNHTQTAMLGRYADLQTAGRYAMIMRIYGLMTQFLYFVDAPFMPAIRSAWAAGDRAWCRLALRRFVLLKMSGAVLAAMLLAVAGEAMARFLSRGVVEFATYDWIVAAGLLLVSMWGGSFSAYLTAVDRIWIQVWLALANGIVTVVLTAILAPTAGVAGALVALGAFALVINSWVLPMLVRLHLGPDPEVTAIPQ